MELEESWNELWRKKSSDVVDFEEYSKAVVGFKSLPPQHTVIFIKGSHDGSVKSITIWLLLTFIIVFFVYYGFELIFLTRTCSNFLKCSTDLCISLMVCFSL